MNLVAFIASPVTPVLLKTDGIEYINYWITYICTVCTYINKEVRLAGILQKRGNIAYMIFMQHIGSCTLEPTKCLHIRYTCTEIICSG